jgi:hypothetical protein
VNKQKLKVLLIPLLGFVLLIVLRGPSTDSSDPVVPRARRPETPLAETIVRRVASRPRELSEIVAFNPFASPHGASPATAGATDPTTAAAATVQQVPLRQRLRIEAIVKREGEFQAIIGGKIVRQGQLIDEGRYRVTAITADDVTFSRLEAAP